MRDGTFWSPGNSHYTEPFITRTVLHSKYRRRKVHKSRHRHGAELGNNHRPEMLKSEIVNANTDGVKESEHVLKVHLCHLSNL